MIKDKAIETLKIEAAAIEHLIPRIDDEFIAAVEKIMSCRGRVVVTGMGKSGHVGRKISATLASTGTPSFFMHPAEAYHGDLGMLTERDILIAISNSGESSEIVNILPVVRRIGATIIAMSGKRTSTLGKNCDYFIDISVDSHRLNDRNACNGRRAGYGFNGREKIYRNGFRAVPSRRRIGQKTFAHCRRRYAQRQRQSDCQSRSHRQRRAV